MEETRSEDCKSKCETIIFLNQYPMWYQSTINTILLNKQHLHINADYCINFDKIHSPKISVYRIFTLHYRNGNQPTFG